MIRLDYGLLLTFTVKLFYGVAALVLMIIWLCLVLE